MARGTHYPFGPGTFWEGLVYHFNSVCEVAQERETISYRLVEQRKSKREKNCSTRGVLLRAFACFDLSTRNNIITRLKLISV